MKAPWWMVKHWMQSARKDVDLVLSEVVYKSARRELSSDTAREAVVMKVLELVDTLNKSTKSRELFLELPEDHQKIIAESVIHDKLRENHKLYSYRSLPTALGFETYLTALKLAGNPTPNFNPPENPTGEGFEFREFVSNETFAKHSSALGQALTLHVLRDKYGFDYVKEFIEWFHKDKVNWTLYNIAEIIENWEGSKELPASWVVHANDNPLLESEEEFANNGFREAGVSIGRTLRSFLANQNGHP